MHCVWVMFTESVLYAVSVWGFNKILTRFNKILTRLPPRDSTLDGRWTRKPFGLSRVQPTYLSIPRPS